MKEPPVNYCCCCFDLKTGNIINATLEIIGSIIGLIFGVIALLASIATQDNENANPIWLNGFGVLTYLIMLIASSMFIHGAKTNNASLLKPFMFTNLLYIVHSGIETFFFSHSGFWIFFNIIGMAFDIYFIVCAYSLYVTIENSKNAPNTNRNIQI